MSFTTPGIVRKVGSLSKLPAAGHVTDDQIDAAILSAEVQMRSRIVLVTDYDTVLAYTDEATAAQKKQKKAYTRAEACFAMAAMPNILTSSQLASTGLIQNVQIGKETRSFSFDSEKQKISDNWISQAELALRDYIVTQIKNSDGKTDIFMAKSSNFAVGAI